MSEVEKARAPKRNCDHMVDPRSKWCADCWAPIAAIIRAEARVEGMREIEYSHSGHYDPNGRRCLSSGVGCTVCIRNRARHNDACAELERLRG
jgi:hypothetical protein